MKQMNDDLIAHVSIVWISFMSFWISIGSLYDEGIDGDKLYSCANLDNMITWKSSTPRVGQMCFINSKRLSICFFLFQFFVLSQHVLVQSCH